MPHEELEQALRDLPTTGTLVKDRAYRQVWRFEVRGVGYYLKFYPRRGKAAKRLVRGDPAMREFLRLQWLQKAEVPAPRAVAVLKGFRIDQRLGDAVILQAIEPAVPLDQLLHEAEMRGKRLPNHRELAARVRDVVRRLARARLGHGDLHLGNFLVKPDGSVHLLDAYAVRRGPVTLRDLFVLAAGASRWSTRADVVRAWRELGPPDQPLPPRNPLGPRIWHKTARRATAGDNRQFGRIRVGDWQGHCFRSWKFPYRWSDASTRTIDPADWAAAWPDLLARVESGQVRHIKQSRSGDVMAATVTLAGRPLDVVIKRPRRKQWHRYLTDPLRGDRATRAWTRAWDLIARNVPTAWPLLVMRRTVLGYPAESYIVFERVDGPPLAHVKLGEMTADERDALFRRVGRLLRRIDDTGFYHRDAKSDNVMLEPRTNTPLLVDLDGIRRLTFGRWSLPRLLTSMKLHKSYTPADSRSLCQGYAPFARVEAERDAEREGEPA